MVVAAAALFLIGVLRSLSALNSLLRSGVEMVLIGLGAAVATYLVGLRHRPAAFTVAWLLLAMSLYAMLAVMLCPPGVMSFPPPVPFPSQHLLCLVWPLFALPPLAFFAFQFLYILPRAVKKRLRARPESS